jgi:hypothetical protein
MSGYIRLGMFNSGYFWFGGFSKISSGKARLVIVMSVQAM